MKNKNKSQVDSEWIIKEVSFATYNREQEVNAKLLTESLMLLQQGVKKWNSYRKSHPKFIPYLKNVNLSWTNKHISEGLNGINFSNADLSETDFQTTCIDDADFTGADLNHAVLIETSLQNSIFDNANLINADLSDSFCALASFKHALLAFSNFSGAKIQGANFYKANLQFAILDRAKGENLKAIEANLSRTSLWQTDFSHADLSHSNLSYSLLVETNLQGANLEGAHVYGVSAWDINNENANQIGLIVSKEDDSPILVDDLDVAQFVHLILNHKNLRKTINVVSERGVLILGRFSNGGLDLLQAIAGKLRELKYLPIIFDFERPDNRDSTETIITLTGLAKFVIADLTGPSVPQELYATVPHFKIPFVPIIQEGFKPYAMINDMLKYSWVVNPIVKFKNKKDILNSLEAKVIAPAEKIHRDRKKELKKLS